MKTVFQISNWLNIDKSQNQFGIFSYCQKVNSFLVIQMQIFRTLDFSWKCMFNCIYQWKCNQGGVLGIWIWCCGQKNHVFKNRIEILQPFFNVFFGIQNENVFCLEDFLIENDCVSIISLSELGVNVYINFLNLIANFEQQIVQWWVHCWKDDC